MTPWELEADIRGAAARTFGLDPQDVPFTWPRGDRAPEGHDAVSPLALRILKQVAAGPHAPGERAVGAVGERIVDRLREEGAGFAALLADRGGFVSVTFTEEARAALLKAAADGPRWLTGRGWTGEGRWPRTPLHEAGPVAQARRHARADARTRVSLAMAAEPPPPGPGEEETGWRDLYRDGEGEELLTPAARALAAIGEDSARVAFCRSIPEYPRERESTGRGLPVLPSAEYPGAWARLTEANPAFRLRYAHAHAVSRVRWVTEGAPVVDGCPTHTAAVRRCLFDGPSAVDSAARRGEPHILVRYLETLASAYDEWRTCPHRAPERAEGAASDPALPAAVAGVLRTGLFLLGVSAPTRL